jgi:hypothetical protein
MHENDKIVCKPAPGAERKLIHRAAGEQARGMTAENRVENNENVKNPDTHASLINLATSIIPSFFNALMF